MILLIVLIIFSCIIFAFSSYIKNKNIYNPITIFCSVWAFVTFLASLRLYGLYETSVKTYLVIWIGIISFVFGCSVLGRFQLRVKVSSLGKENEFTFNKNIIYIIILTATVILIVTAYKSINLLFSGHNLAYIRYIAQDEVMGSNNGLILILFNYIAQPICQLLIPLSALMYFSNNKDNKIIILSIIPIILLVISNGGRFILLYYVINFVFIGMILNAHINISNKLKRRINVILLIVISIIIYMTVARNGYTIGKSFYTYICGCVPHLSLRLSNFDGLKKYTYGISSFQGFVRPIFSIITKIGITDNFPSLLQLAENLNNEVLSPIYIGENLRYNAFVSLFYYFYIDFNLFGVVFLSMFYGYICKLFYYRAKKNGSNSNIIAYSLLLQSIVTSMFRFQFSSFMFAMTFIYLFLIKPKKIKL
ncbi:MAG: O-antigen polymerase [Pleomorphochaeta sp.]